MIVVDMTGSGSHSKTASWNGELVWPPGTKTPRVASLPGGIPELNPEYIELAKWLRREGSTADRVNILGAIVQVHYICCLEPQPEQALL
jgi:hypothetical protein